MSALDGLSHEEVAGRLDTTVETTRSLLARARENLRRTAAARETACQAVCDALDEAAAGRVRASEIARRHLWSCADCRAYQRDLRAAPRRLRRLAAWSPWGLVAQLLGGGGAATVQKVAVGACCAIVGVGGAVAVPEIAVHSRHLPEIAASVPVPVAPEPALRPQRGKRAAATPVPAAPAPAAGAGRPCSPASRVPKAAAREDEGSARPSRASRGGPGGERSRARRAGACSQIMRTFWNSNPSRGREAADVRAAAHLPAPAPREPGADGHLVRLHKQTSGRKATPPPPKGIDPAGRAGSDRDAHPGRDPAAADADRRAAVPTPTPEPVATATPTAAPVETPVATPTVVATPTP